MVDAAGQQAGDAVARRVADEQLRLLTRQVARLPLATLLAESVLCWLLLRAGWAWLALGTLALMLALNLLRWRYVGSLRGAEPRDAAQSLGRLTALQLAMGAVRGAMAVMLFLQPVQVEHYVFTLICVGLLAGAVTTVAGQTRPFVAWAALACGPLSLAWVLQGTLDGSLIGLTMVALAALLATHVRDEGQSLRQLVQLAFDNESLAASLRQARDAAVAASQSKTRFFAAASHDLRQPLHALSINATTLELLGRRHADPLVAELSRGITRALAQSNALLDSLLDISNLDANAVQPRLQRVELSTLLPDLREQFAALAAQKGLTLTVDVPAEVAAVQTDPDLLRRILGNLVDNALKFCTIGGVTIRARAQGTSVGLSVIDTGPGITPDEQQHVFEEFYQVGNASRDRSKGLGLGLAIVRRIAVLLDAGLTLHSVPGQGTTVALELSLAPPEQVAATRDADEAAAEPLAALRGLKVLAVDDEPEILRALQGLLSHLGCIACCAADGAAAEAAVAEGFRPQVLLVDHRLRHERGTELIRRLQSTLGPVAALLVTGDTEPTTLQQAHAAGHRLIHKPVQGHQLALALAEVARVRDAGSGA